MGGHAAAGHVNRVGRGEHSAVWLGLQVRIRALDIPVSKGVAGRAIDAEAVVERSSSHATSTRARSGQDLPI